jgi:hypothetical protein
MDERQGRAEHPETSATLLSLARVKLALGLPAEAEPFARRAHAIREKALLATHWLRASSASQLGEILVHLNRYDEAEPLLVAGYEGMKDHPRAPMDRKRQSIVALVLLYDRSNRPDDASRWRRELGAFDARNPATNPAPAP